LAEPVAPLAELQIEGYEILGCLGEGGMGIVYLARQVSLDRKVAIKVMSPALLKDPSFGARFDREIAALVRLSHPHIVTIFDRGQSAGGHVYYIMEYVEGKDGGAPIDLERLIADRCLNSQRVRELMLQVVQALGFAHCEGIIHRDVKPSNILIDRHGFAKVADFGIASMRAGRVTRHVTVTNQSVGTAIYMSPEQQRDAASVDHRSDIYAAGVMLYQMLTGDLPVAGYEPPSRVVAGLPPQWDAILAKALQQRPENRFADMRSFEAALKSIGQTTIREVTSIPPSPAALPPGTPRGTSVGRAPPTGIQQSGVVNRADVIKRAEQLFIQGQWKKAAELMGKAAGFFVGDEEITALLVQYREKANQIDEVLARMAALSQQNHWCEVSQILAELQQTGVSIKGLDQYAAAAQQRFKALQPLVATARTLLQQGRTAEAAAQANRALQYVADHAEALEIADTASKRSTRRHRSRRFVIGLVAVTCLAAIAAGAYLYFTESVVVEKARRQIGNKEYEDASRTLTDLPHRWFVEREATYLQALTDLKKYASAKDIEDDTLLQTATQRLKDLFNASEAWRTQAKLDLADAMAQVPLPPDADDTLTRGLKIAKSLNELKAVEPVVLAEALLTKAEGRSEFRSPASDATPVDYVKQILEWDPAKARKVVGLALPKGGSAQQGLLAIRGWAEKTPPLAGALSAAELQIADEHVAAGRYDEAKAFTDAAKQIDLRFDTWGYWERHFQKTDGKNSRDAIEILTYMVEGEQNPERLTQAVGLYSDLRKRFSGVEMTPPPEIRDTVDAAQFREVIVDAEQSVKNGQYQDARTKLDDARSRFPSLWSRDADADRLDKEVCFHLDFATARQSFASGDLDAALTKVKNALQIRPEDKEAGELRDKIQTTVDKAEVEQHRRTAESVITAENPRSAVDEIVKAYEILDKPSNAAWSKPGRSAVDELTKTLVGKLNEQATELSDKRQYEEAKEKVRLGLRLPSRNEKLSELLKDIEQREADPKTVNLSGRWVLPNGAECELTDSGTDIIGYKAVRLPNTIRACIGEWKRMGEKLSGRFRVVFAEAPRRETEGTVSATIRDTKTLTVFWQERTWIDRPKNGTWTWQGRGEGSWTKQEGRTDTSARPGEAEEPRARSSQDNPFGAPQRSRKTHHAPFRSQTNAAPGPHPQDAPRYAAEPLKNGAVVDGDVSIAIVRPIAKHSDAAEITLGFRRVGDRWEGSQLQVVVHDDRSNEYSGESFSLGNSFGTLKGTPPAFKQLPVGFTWVTTINVNMPAIAPIARVDLVEGLFGKQSQPLDFGNPVRPSFEFEIPSERLLTPGTKLNMDDNLVAEIGRLNADSSSTAMQRVSVSLPISVTNEDYNPHDTESFDVYVQLDNGEVRQYSTTQKGNAWSSEVIPGKSTQKYLAAVLNSTAAGGLRAVLLYRRRNRILSGPEFCGFVPIPDDVRQQIKSTTSDPAPTVSEESHGRIRGPVKPRPGQE
jgi:serine/threonine protein kinase